MITYEMAKRYIDGTEFGHPVSVIPVSLSFDGKKYQKKPLVAWKAYQEKLATDKELHEWFDGNTTNAIGMVTGKISGFIVLDHDRYKEKDCQHDFYSPITVNTISGGEQLYYRWTEALVGAANQQDDFVDVRGDTQFVVLPGSEADGKKYEFARKVEAMFCKDFPQQYKVYCKKDEAKPHEENVSSVGETGLKKGYDGNRNETAASVAGTLIKKIDRSLWESIGWKSFQWWNKTHLFEDSSFKVSYPLFENELRTTWNSIISEELQKKTEQKTLIEFFTGNEIEDNYNEKMASYGEGLSTGFEALDRYFKFIPEQVYILSSPTGQGKTTLSLNMATRIASLGENVLFASLEQGVFVSPRIKTMIGGRIPETLSLLNTPGFLTADDIVESVNNFEHKPKIFFVDHLHYFKKTGKGATQDMDENIYEMASLAKRLQIPVVVIAHLRKMNDSDKEPTMDDLRDSSSLSQAPRVVMLLHRKPNEGQALSKSYLSDFGSLFIQKNQITGRTGIVSFTMKESGEFIFH